MAGNLDSDSVIWVIGESAGKDGLGDTAALPVSEDTSGLTAAEAYTDALETRLVASGVLPN